MAPKLLLRIAAVAAGLFTLGHTLGGMIFATSHGPDGEAVLKALGAYRFDVMGSSRSHLDFYVGEGWYLSVALAVMVVMCWLLSNATEESPSLVRRLSLVIGLFFVASVGLCAAYLFVAPLVFSAVAASSAGAAWWKLRS